MPAKHAPARRRFWRRLSLTAQLLVALVPALLVVVLAAWALNQHLGESLVRSDEAARDARLIARHEALINAALDAETGLRGYLITGDGAFLSPYQDAADDFRTAHRKLMRDYDGDARATVMLDEMSSAFAAWREEIAEPLVRTRQALPVGVARDADRAADRFAEIVSAVRTARLDERLRDRVNTGAARVQTRLQTLAERTGEQAFTARWAALAERVTQYAETVSALIADGAVSAAQRAEVVDTGRSLRADFEEAVESAQAAEARIVDRVSAGGGKRLTDRIRRINSDMIEAGRVHRDQAIAAAAEVTESAVWLGTLAPLFAFAIGLVAVTAIGVDAVAGIRRLIRAADNLAAGHLSARVDLNRGDEVGHLASSFNSMAAELETRRRQSELLDRFRDLLITSETGDEAFRVVESLAPQFFPGSSGCVYLIAESRNIATPRAAWPRDAAAEPMIGPTDCRALRAGRVYQVAPDEGGVFCPHLEERGVAEGICVPLVAQDNILGVLSIALGADDGVGQNAIDRALAERVGEHLALFLANLRLRTQLRDQSIRDSLTGLFNRRYLDETLERELSRVLRGDAPLALIALDVDHFKRFNDDYGHDAGDVVLAAVGAELQRCVRAADIVCRAGGEEFVMVLPEAHLAVARERAEEVRGAVAELVIEAGGRALPGVTVSLGVAVAPDDADTAQTLLRQADEALYRAKRAGRNRVEAAADRDQTASSSGGP